VSAKGDYSYEHRIEQEFGRPFIDVALGYLRVNDSVSVTAQLLGMPARELYRALERNNIKRIWAVSR